MADKPSVFGGKWTRPDQSGMGHSRRELQDRASFDCAPAAGMSCVGVLVISGAMWVLIISGLVAAARGIA